MDFFETVPDKSIPASERHLDIRENLTHITFDVLFAPYLCGATNIEVVDPYIITAKQQRNFTEFLATVVKAQECPVRIPIRVHLTTRRNIMRENEQLRSFTVMQESAKLYGVDFQWYFSDSTQCHARSIKTDTGWKILLDRGLDIFIHYAYFNAFDLSNTLQECRSCRPFEITYLKDTHQNIA